MSKRSRSEKGKSIVPSSSTTPTPKRPFVNDLAENRFIQLSKKSVISGRCVILKDFEHLGIPRILKRNSLHHFMTIREPVYTSLVHYFYANYAFEGDRVRSRVLGRDIDIPIARFADLLHLSSGGVDVYTFDLHDFEYPDGESALTASTLIHGDDNPGLVRNEEVNKFTLTSQVLAKFIFYNILPKSGEYSNARGSVPLIIYCLLKGIKIDFPHLIATHMASDHIRMSSRHLPYGMLITHLLQRLGFDLSSETPCQPAINLDSVLLKRMQAQMRRHAQEHPPAPPADIPGSSSAPGSSSVPGISSASVPSLSPEFQSFISSEIRSQIQEHQSWIEQRDAAFRTDLEQRDAALRAEMDSRFQGFRNDMTYFANAMRFVDSQFETLFAKFDMLSPDPTTISRPLPSSGPPFPIRDPTAAPPPQPGVAGIDPEEGGLPSSSDDDDGDETMAEGDAEESSSEEDDAEEGSSKDDAAGGAE